MSQDENMLEPYKYAETLAEFKDLPDYYFLSGLLGIWGRVNNRRYLPYLGAINWAIWDFARQPHTVAIVTAGQSFLGDINSCTLSFELMEKMPALPDGQPARGIGPKTQAIMKRDVRQAVVKLRDLKYPDSVDRVVTRFWKGFDNMVDVSDANLRVQGVVATLRVDY